jgi:hypothetical protein
MCLISYMHLVSAPGAWEWGLVERIASRPQGDPRLDKEPTLEGKRL